MSFYSHPWIKIGVFIRKPSNRSQIVDFLARMILKFGGWPRKTIGPCFYATSSFLLVNSNWSYSQETLNSAHNRRFFGHCDLEIGQKITKNNNAFLLCHPKLCAFGNALFRLKRSIFLPVDLEIWWMTTKNNRTNRVCLSKLCASLNSHLLELQSGNA